jgi:hypothetical protein
MASTLSLFRGLVIYFLAADHSPSRGLAYKSLLGNFHSLVEIDTTKVRFQTVLQHNLHIFHEFLNI